MLSPMSAAGATSPARSTRSFSSFTTAFSSPGGAHAASDDESDDESVVEMWRDAPVVVVLRGGFRMSGTVASIDLASHEVVLNDGAQGQFSFTILTILFNSI